MPLTYRFDKEGYLKLSDEVLDSILEAIKKSRETSKETGFYICGTRDKNFPGKMCIGIECAIEPRDCHSSRKISFFHTHPTQRVSEPSVADILFSIYNYLVMCVHGLESASVCCYKPKREAYDSLAMRIPSEKVNNIWERYMKWQVKFREKTIAGEPTYAEWKEYKDMYKDLMEMVVEDCWKLKYVESKRDPWEVEI